MHQADHRPMYKRSDLQERNVTDLENCGWEKRCTKQTRNVGVTVRRSRTFWLPKIRLRSVLLERTDKARKRLYIFRWIIGLFCESMWRIGNTVRIQGTQQGINRTQSGSCMCAVFGTCVHLFSDLPWVDVYVLFKPKFSEESTLVGTLDKLSGIELHNAVWVFYFHFMNFLRLTKQNNV